MKFIPCKAYHCGNDEFDCWYENAKGFSCENCICNGGRFSPISGNAWKEKTAEKYCKLYGIGTHDERKGKNDDEGTSD